MSPHPSPLSRLAFTDSVTFFSGEKIRTFNERYTHLKARCNFFLCFGEKASPLLTGNWNYVDYNQVWYYKKKLHRHQAGKEHQAHPCVAYHIYHRVTPETQNQLVEATLKSCNQHLPPDLLCQLLAASVTTINRLDFGGNPVVELHRHWVEWVHLFRWGSSKRNNEQKIKKFTVRRYNLLWSEIHPPTQQLSWPTGKTGKFSTMRTLFPEKKKGNHARSNTNACKRGPEGLLVILTMIF